MAYLMLLLTFFLIIILIKNHRNRYSWLLTIMIVGLDLALFASIVQISRLNNYYQPKSLFFVLDYWIYLHILQNKIVFSSVNRLLNIGMSLFLFVFPLFTYEFTAFRTRKFDKRRVLIFVFSILYLLFNIWFYDPKTSSVFYLYIVGHNPGGLVPKEAFKELIQRLDALNFSFILLYLTYPFYVLGKYYFNTKVNFKKMQVIPLAFCLMLLDLFFITIFMFGPFRKSYFQTEPVYWIFPINKSIPYFYFDILPLAMLLSIPIMFLLLIKYQTLDTNDFFRNLYIKRNTVLFNRYLRGIFHSHKNTMFMMKILAEQAEAAYGTEEGLVALRKITHSTDVTLTTLTKTLDSMKTVKPKPSSNKVINVIEASLHRINIPDSITIRKIYNVSEAYMIFDGYQLSDVFDNIIQNSVDAITTAKRENGVITIEVDMEVDWIMVNIVDNGCGISKNEMKNIFKPFYSTKSKQYNWGIGLSHVYRIMKRNSGFITVDSKVGEYTKFQLLFPKKKGEDNLEQD